MRKTSIAAAALALALVAPAAHASLVSVPVGGIGASIAGVDFGYGDYVFDNFSDAGGDDINAQVIFTNTASGDVMVDDFSINGNGLVADLAKYTATLYAGAYDGTGIAPAVIGTFVIAADGGLAATGSDSYALTFADFTVGAGESFTLSWTTSVATAATNFVSYTFTTPVPVPAALPLLLTALGGVAVLRGRKSA